jgi:hypothetical protein
MGYGIGAAVLMTGAALYGVRRRMAGMSARKGLGKSHTWLQFHVYGSTLFLLLVFMHTGFKLPTGTLYWWLWMMSIWVTITGLIGVVLQKWIPSILSSGLSIEVMPERIPELIEEARMQAAELVTQCSQPIVDFFHKRIERSLRRPEARMTYFFDITGGIQRRTKQFQFLSELLLEDERQKLNELERILRSKLEIDAHFTLQRVLRHWLYIHLPPSIVLVILVLIHLFAVIYY